MVNNQPSFTACRSSGICPRTRSSDLNVALFGAGTESIARTLAMPWGEDLKFFVKTGWFAHGTGWCQLTTDCIEMTGSLGTSKIYVKSNFYNKKNLNSAWIDVSIHFFLRLWCHHGFPICSRPEKHSSSEAQIGAWFPLKTEEDTQEPERLPEALVFWTWCQVVCKSKEEVISKAHRFLWKNPYKNDLVLQVDR